MNSMVNFKPLKRHWKVASSFRDASLHQIFQIACDLLSLVSANQMQENQQVNQSEHSFNLFHSDLL